MRNYDVEPIVLKDYNAAFGWNVFKYTTIPVIFIVSILYPLITSTEISYQYTTILMFGIPLMNLYQRSKQRKIILSENKIEYTDFNDKLSIINLNFPNTLKKSSQNYYYKKQNLSYLYFIFVFIFISVLMQSLFDALFLIIGALIVGVVLTFITKYILSDRGFLWYTSILVQQEDDVIAIPLYKAKDYEEVKQYFKKRQIDYETLPIFHKIFYGLEAAFTGLNIFSSGDTEEIICEDCRNTISKEKFSCPHCGNPQSETKIIETKNNDKNYSFKAILKNKNDFSKIKELVLNQYKPLGYTKLTIDKEDSLMLNNEPKTQSYIYVKLENFEFTAEVFNTKYSTIKDDAFELFR